MDVLVFILVVIVVFVVGSCIYYYNLPDEELNKKVAKYDVKIYGEPNANIICPHCQSQGQVHTKKVDKKVGISGGKATAAILTSGVSLLATGLSRKDSFTQAHCFKCESTWTF